nr:hypothetical protein [uncultured Draconibacterium sp.]
MKKLGKLSINNEKLINDKELVNLKGGYGTGCCTCWRTGRIIAGSSSSTCNDDCYDLDSTFGTWSC